VTRRVTVTGIGIGATCGATAARPRLTVPLRQAQGRPPPAPAILTTRLRDLPGCPTPLNLGLTRPPPPTGTMSAIRAEVRFPRWVAPSALGRAHRAGYGKARFHPAW
jgi:hypothetical protein